MGTKSPFFSIVIPTRNRHETLPYTIKTILKQSFTDYELIICDNNSSEHTREIVHSFNHPSIKYIRSDTSLAMVQNWELAVSHAKGRYVTVVADNDGFIDGSLQFLYTLLEYNYFPNIVRWEKNLYQWPDIEAENRNTMLLNTRISLKQLSSEKIIQKVLDGVTKFQNLPMIYNSVISMELIVKLKGITGKVFNSRSPDLYSGFAFAYLNKSYLSLSLPITIGANSSKSNGVSSLKKESPIINEFRELNNAANIIRHPKVPFVRAPFIIAPADSFFRAQEDLNIKNSVLNRKKMIKRLLRDTLIYDEKEIENFQNEILRTCQDDKKLLEFAQRLLEETSFKIAVEKKPSKPLMGFNKTALILDGEKQGIKNIDDVSNFMAHFYDYSLSSVNLPEISKRLQEIPKDARIAIWGRGESSKNLQKNIQKYRKDIKIEYIVDSFFEDATCTPKVIRPHKIKNVKYLIIASMYVQPIKKCLDELHAEKRILLYKFTQ